MYPCQNIGTDLRHVCSVFLADFVHVVEHNLSAGTTSVVPPSYDTSLNEMQVIIAQMLLVSHHLHTSLLLCLTTLQIIRITASPCHNNL